MESNSYLLTYCYETIDHTLGFGSATITQSQYAPIDQAIIDDAIKWVHKKIGLPESLKITPLAFIRFEPPEGTKEGVMKHEQ